MRNHRFYTEVSLSPNNSFTLATDTSRHIHQVLRLKVGDAIDLFNGDGYDYHACITATKKQAVDVSIQDRTLSTCEPSLNIHLYQGLSRGEKMDWILQKATELGITSITPVLSERCNAKVSKERQMKKQQHWQKVLHSACEQSGRATIPTLHSPAPFIQAIEQVEADKKWILAPLPTRSVLQNADETAPQSIAVFIGPEGGFSPKELELAQNQKIAPLSLGPRVLRTETAPLAIVSILQYLWG